MTAEFNVANMTRSVPPRKMWSAAMSSLHKSNLDDLRAAETAIGYCRRGWNVVPIPERSKIPSGAGWQARIIREADVPRFFNGRPQNVGVILGPTSNGLTDIDLDCDEAIVIAPFVLPTTGALFGRASKPDSHWLYVSTLATTAGKAVVKLADPTRLRGDKNTLLEVRIGGDKGAQTVFPGSVHECGEPLRWGRNGEPATVDDDDLLRRARLLGALCLLARNWPGEGARHDAALTVGGFLARCGHQAAQIKHLVEAVAIAAGDNEKRDRMRAAEDHAIEHQQGRPSRGYPSLAETFGDKVAARVAEWLDYRGSRTDAGTTTTTRARTAPSRLANDIVTEDNAAQQFVELHAGKLRYCHDYAAWFRWTGVNWEQDKTGAAFHWARELARRLSQDHDERRRYITSKTAFAAGVERFAKHDPRVAVTMGHWDRNLWQLGTPLGTVELRTGKLRPASPEDGITKLTLVGPGDDGCPRWLKFLEQATGHDQGLIRFLQQWCGYCLTGVTCEHALVFVHGPGGNGKSVFLNVVTDILGDYAATAAMEAFTASSNDRHPTDLAMLRGARLVTASETEEGRSWSETRIKQLTGGDAITARFMRQDFFTFTPQLKLTVIGNHKPSLHNVDDAARRRINIVPFTHKPATPDRDLEAKLMTEAPGILSWMISGCADWQQHGLIRPAVVVDATREYFSDQDLFAQWLEDDCRTEPGNTALSAASSVLFRSWSDYAKAVGGKPGTPATFKERLTTAGFRFYRSKRAREYFGIELAPRSAPDPTWF